MEVDDRADLLANPPFELSDADREVLAQTDAEFVPHTWEELREVIATKDTSNLRRTPTGLANYIRWIRHIRSHWASISSYILVSRLGWAACPASPATDEAVPPAAADPTVFADRADYAVRRNDWPYGCEAGIVHLVVWLKGRIATAGPDGDPTPADEARINAFVAATFAAKIAGKPHPDGSGSGGGSGAGWIGRPAPDTQRPMEVLWFRNRTRWQSVRALEHVHVLLRNVPEPWITAWTGGQAPEQTIAARWARGERGEQAATVK